MNDAPYLTDIDNDICDISTWLDKDQAIIRRRLGDRPAKRNTPYKNAPNQVVPLIDDNVRARTEQEISMILNAPEKAIFIPNGNDPLTGGSIPPQDVTMARNAFNTYLTYLSNYRAKKEEAVDTKNARGFAVTKLIEEEHPQWGTIPSFETVDPRDLIVPSGTRDIQTAERVCHILRMSRRDLKDRIDRGWNKRAVKNVLDKLTTNNKDGDFDVSESNNDDNGIFTVTKELIGLNKSTNKEVIIWEIGHYATQWDIDNSNGIVGLGDKCVSWICPDVPNELLRIIPWREDDILGAEEITDEQERAFRIADGLETFNETREQGKDKPWPYVQHRYEYRTRLWYDSRGLGHLLMDPQIAATAMENMKLVQIDFMGKPMFQSKEDVNKQNVSMMPGVILPANVTPVPQNTNALQALNFEVDQQRRVAGTRAGSGAGVYSSDVNESRKLQMSASEAMIKNTQQDIVSSSSVDRFNDADRELFRQLWAAMKAQRTPLPIIVNGEFIGTIQDRIYDYDFIIEPAASQKTLNPAQQFGRAKEILDMVSATAATTGADVAAGTKHIVNMADPNFANILFGGGQEGELPITTTLNQMQQQIEQMDAAHEQIMAELKQVGERAGAAIELAKDVADVTMEA